MRMNETIALMKSPSANLLPFTAKSIAEKSGFPIMAAIGVIRSLTNAVTTAPNGPHYDGDGKVEDIVPEHKLLEALQPRSVADFSSLKDYRLDRQRMQGRVRVPAVSSRLVAMIRAAAVQTREP